ncbi:hypothetical protein [Paenibacillus hunanensis]|uniref:Uncharacterized protein n=1 Tax=Paenibacillus hunanensis TaxID=539262 RepID=A0ABU1IV02_9BACL|nr:hypothetical protein [Paenibacillus hunanensis]MDR6243086.1 hypothetical protein [Paenibacillus hunanensis]GGJ11999.1 hypothetical protein GCM10008022_21390 [Paenibacillus hunanensis]
MADSHGYMEYDFASLKKVQVLGQKEAINVFLNCFRLKSEYSFKGMLEFADLEEILVEDSYLVMNNEPRRKGKQIFFTGNVVEAKKDDLLFFLSEPIQRHDLIVPLMIVPVTDGGQPSYIVATQEDPIFEWFAAKEGQR